MYPMYINDPLIGTSVLKTPSNQRWKSEHYQKFRRKMLYRAGYKCQECGSNNNLTIHHIIPYRERRDLCLVESNVEVLCRRCHDKRH